MSHYLTVDDLTEYERPVTGPLDTSMPKSKGVGMAVCNKSGDDGITH